MASLLDSFRELFKGQSTIHVTNLDRLQEKYQLNKKKMLVEIEINKRLASEVSRLPKPDESNPEYIPFQNSDDMTYHGFQYAILFGNSYLSIYQTISENSSRMIAKIMSNIKDFPEIPSFLESFEQILRLNDKEKEDYKSYIIESLEKNISEIEQKKKIYTTSNINYILSNSTSKNDLSNNKSLLFRMYDILVEIKGLEESYKYRRQVAKELDIPEEKIPRYVSVMETRLGGGIKFTSNIKKQKNTKKIKKTMKNKTKNQRKQ